ncbi:monocarboxylate transporter 12-like [Physella acuta]|uniref:monocarboxylate transporter 12-like n=1 Tax=Physella acuta TaxID=109671 RepID=UPI0027DB4D90|nr:monocarboxylate transporter 12-like [Physella acuta]
MGDVEKDGDEPDDYQSEIQKLQTRFGSVSPSKSAARGEGQTPGFQKDGFWSWVACFCATMNQLLIFGTVNVYSLFLVKFVKEFGCSTAEAAWLGSMTFGLMKLLGPLSSSLNIHLNNRVVMILGAVLCTLSFLASSFAPNFMTLFGTLCVPFATGAAFTITPSVVVPVIYFRQHQSVAMGIVASGSSLGMLILAPVVQIMLDALNWRIMFRIHAGALSFLIFLNFFIKPVKRQKPISDNKKPFCASMIEDLTLWKNRVFLLWAFSMAIVYFGYQIPNMLLVSYAGFLGISASRASYIVMAMGGATTVSRLITGKILTCQLLSRLHFKQTIFVVMGTSYLLLAHVTTIEGLYVFAVVRGLLDGAHIVMLPMLTASMVGQNKALLGWGYIAGAISITYTIGPPIAGYLKDVTGNYKMPFTVAGLPMIASGLLLFWLPWAQRTEKTESLADIISIHDRLDEVKSDETISKRRHTISKVFPYPVIRELELMPLDVPDIVKSPPTSIKHTPSFKPKRKKFNLVQKSASLPETRDIPVFGNKTPKVKSEPLISFKDGSLELLAEGSSTKKRLQLEEDVDFLSWRSPLNPDTGSFSTHPAGSTEEREPPQIQQRPASSRRASGPLSVTCVESTSIYSKVSDYFSEKSGEDDIQVNIRF